MWNSHWTICLPPPDCLIYVISKKSSKNQNKHHLKPKESAFKKTKWAPELIFLIRFRRLLRIKHTKGCVVSFSKIKAHYTRCQLSCQDKMVSDAFKLWKLVRRWTPNNYHYFPPVTVNTTSLARFKKFVSTPRAIKHYWTDLRHFNQAKLGIPSV